MLGQRRRRWPNNKPTLEQRLEAAPCYLLPPKNVSPSINVVLMVAQSLRRWASTIQPRIQRLLSICS